MFLASFDTFKMFKTVETNINLMQQANKKYVICLEIVVLRKFSLLQRKIKSMAYLHSKS